MNALAASVLRSLGWTPCLGGAAIASKLYPTAVGPKKALIYANGTTLSGEYWSEGNNVLSTCWVLLSNAPDAEALRDAITRFASAVDHAVGESYAARLLRRFPETFN